jgi:hypothetical protein
MTATCPLQEARAPGDRAWLGALPSWNKNAALGTGSPVPPACDLGCPKDRPDVKRHVGSG